jgi:hypothetical protein
MAQEGSDQTKVARYKFWGLILAAVISGLFLLITRFCGPNTDQQPGRKISGFVNDAGTSTPLVGVIVLLQKLDRTPFSQDTTDSSGQYILKVPKGISEVLIVVAARGYIPFSKKTPINTGRLDIVLAHMPIHFGIPQGVAFNKAVEIVASKLNVSVVFSQACSDRAKTVQLDGAELRGDPRDPPFFIKALIDRLRDVTMRYAVRTIEPRRRYEIRCY